MIITTDFSSVGEIGTKMDKKKLIEKLKERGVTVREDSRLPVESFDGVGRIIVTMKMTSEQELVDWVVYKEHENFSWHSCAGPYVRFVSW